MDLRESIFGLAQAYRTHIKDAVNANELGLNGMHVRCLHTIAKLPQCTANTIVQQLGKDKAQIARLIKDMIAKGWLEKKSSEQDKRSQILTLSKSGAQLQQQLSHLEKNLEESITAGLTTQEVEDFQRVSTKMLANLAAHTWNE
ncbi:helix-turn-helix domain-containing protein [Aliiglaciecola sp. NS0011-25]|uniref:MarR family winged helix-turn-helix transcriptional regulator n=1 Tax=Aliiglaciecola sp. NS0011-25 TaxID=3127654 RepID=UPI003104DA1D